MRQLLPKSNWYRVIALLCLFLQAVVIALFLLGDLSAKLVLIFSCVVLCLLACITAVLRFHEIYQKQEEELRMYQTYVKPLEELVKDVRARQHEFDNHLNAILNMHVTIDTYEELVRAQAAYIYSVVDDARSAYLPLLKISDKVLAGFLYAKMVSVAKPVRFELVIGSREIFCNMPEKDIVAIVGTLFDNAVEACTEERNRVKLFLDGQGEHLLFEIWNEFEDVPLAQLGQFFERGYSTKGKLGKRGLGLYQAKRLVEQWKGALYVEKRVEAGVQYICFRAEL